MEQDLAVLRHSLSHIMAQAVLELYPKTLLGIGPAIENGFYYDFDFAGQEIAEKDLPKIEEKMAEIIKKDLPFEKSELTKEQAKSRFKNEKYKAELIDDIEDEKVTLYQNNGFIDLCKGPHLDSTGQINPNSFKLLKIAGAYWKGNENNPMLTRIYGTGWETPQELKNYLLKLEQIEKSDHRRLNENLKIFLTDEEVGAGLILWQPKGAVLRQVIEDYWKKLHRENGYQYVYTPHIGNIGLWEKSGHLAHYSEMMYAPMAVDKAKYMVKPMNCPFHIKIFQNETRSYRDLPIRYCELAAVYRYEKAGVLHGLLRVRGFTQDDAHIFCRPDQLTEEINKTLDLALATLKKFGFEKFDIELAVKDKINAKNYAGKEEIWEKAEKALTEVLDEKKLKYHRQEGEAKFYGPSIDIKLIDALGRSWQGPTIQLDFNLPEKFAINFINQAGKKELTVMIHRTIFGSMERFIANLLEHYQGSLPVWLAPTQVKILPIAEEFNNNAEEIKQVLEKENIRVELDKTNETINKKIRQAQMEKIPLTIVYGQKEKDSNRLTVRKYGKDVLESLTVEALTTTIKRGE